LSRNILFQSVEKWENPDHYPVDASEESDKFSKGALVVGSTYIFIVTVIKAAGLPVDYTDIFCQFRFV
jgi:hypothetical protein